MVQRSRVSVCLRRQIEWGTIRCEERPLEETELFLLKALDSINGAESEFANRRYDNCANRCYYACFQAAISALLRE